MMLNKALLKHYYGIDYWIIPSGYLCPPIPGRADYKEKLFDLTICNPPFHSSFEEAQSGTLRKLRNLNQKPITNATLNFGGKNKELWCEGGEEKFVQKMISQSKLIPLSCFWFSTLISRQAHLKSTYKALEFAGAHEIKTISMCQGNKTSRIIAWTFLTIEQQKEWRNTRWKKIT